MNAIVRLLAITLISAGATTVALKANAFSGPEHDHRPPMPLHDLREILPTLKLNGDQEALLQKAQGAFMQLRASHDYRQRKGIEEMKQGLASNTPLSALARKAGQEMQEGMKQAQDAEGQWIAFLDSLDSAQSGKVRKHLLERLENMDKARARMADARQSEAPASPMAGRGEPGRPHSR